MPLELIQRVSAQLDFTYPPFLELYLETLAKCRARGADYFCLRLFSTYHEQDMIYAQGRTLPGGIVTHAKGGQSAHNFGAAGDGCRDGDTTVQGLQPDWKTEDYAVLGEEAKKLGLEWAGDWHNIHDPGHVQWPGLSNLKLLAQLDEAFQAEGLHAAWNVLDHLRLA